MNVTLNPELKKFVEFKVKSGLYQSPSEVVNEGVRLELLLASNATLDGPSSAASMAISCGWPRLVVPALLAGLWGYVIGTPIGVLVVEFFKR